MKPTVLLGALLSAGTALAQQADDLFDFIPPGGRSLVERAIAADATALVDRLALAQSAVDWAESLAGIDDLDGVPLEAWQKQTIADYLGYAGGIADPADLPPDGRDMMLARCQSCHIITVTITQDRSREAWLATLGRTSHVDIPLNAAERDQLADYLTVNAGLPIDVIPPELRAGGASY